MTSDVDLRGFAYALEPLLKRQQWSLDALQAKLARLDKTIAEVTGKRERAQASYDEYARTIRTKSGEVLEPAMYGRALAQLVTLQGEVIRLNQQLEGLRQERRGLQEECLRSHVKLNMTSSHKEECLAEYMNCQQSRLNSERDRDWLASAAFADEEKTPC